MLVLEVEALRFGGVFEDVVGGCGLCLCGLDEVVGVLDIKP